MLSDSYDLVIVGGGIHGVGVAQAAVARGHTVLLLEQNTLACGTSSRSSKLIHGGLRYLESGQFRLVRECLKERALLLKIAPDLVKLRPFFIPIYYHSHRRPWQIRTGLGLYSLLSGLCRDSLFRSIPRQKWGELDGLNTEGLQAVYQYWDAQTDDAALTKAVMRSAQSLGAVLSLSSNFTRAEQTDKFCHVYFIKDGKEHQCKANVLVNAAGPWVNQVLERITPKTTALAMDMVQGAHLLIDVPSPEGIYYLESPQDRRAIFVMPWHNKVLLGTTETIYRGDPAKTSPLPEEIDYLLGVMNYYFPAYALTKDSIIESFAGLRVLPAGKSRLFGRSRETLLHVNNRSNPRVLSIYGGKLTAYRITADRVMKMMGPYLPAAVPVADPKQIILRPE